MRVQSEQSRTADRLWSEYAATRDPRKREEIVRQFQRLAFSIANRFARRGMDSEDVVQVAMMGLVKAVDRFDPSTNYRFSTFATPTILGEIRRYFRDHYSPVHIPRGMQDLAQRVRRAHRELAAGQAGPPTPAELAAWLEVPQEDVERALAVEELVRPLSLDGERERSARGPRALDETLGAEDLWLAEAERRVSVRQAVGRLSEPLARIIRMRYLGEMSQREVARRLGISQMQVSRLERRALGVLRRQFAVS